MTGLEITLVIIGVIFLLGSFFVQDKLSGADMKQIADVSEKEIAMILDKQMKKASSAIEDKVDLAVEETYDATRRAIEKETQEKLSAIGQYSDTVIESVNKSHNEVMFLYSMLNDKHKELTSLAAEISTFTEKLKKKEDEMLERIGFAAEMNASGASVAGSPQAVSLRSTSLPEGETSPAASETAVSDVKKTPAKTRAAKTAKTSKQEKAVGKEAVPEENKSASRPRKRSLARKQAPLPEIPVSGELVKENEEILRMHMEGMNEVEIAKTLGRGLGEVRFVIGLYRGDVVR